MSQIRCKCGSRLKLPASMINKPVKCPSCKQTLCAVAGGNPEDNTVFEHRLCVQSGPEQVGREYLLGGSAPITVGKLDDVVICLPGQEVSRRHCRLEPTATGWRIVDDGSTNGIKVNHVSVRSHNLSHGDLVRVGEYRMVYQSPNGDADRVDLAQAGVAAVQPHRNPSDLLANLADGQALDDE